MSRNKEFIKNVKITDIPWHRLVTTYDRATKFPQYINLLLSSDISEVDNAIEQLALNIEHQSTLYPATPFTMIFLARIFEKTLSKTDQDLSRYVVINLLDLFIQVAEICNIGNEMEHAEPLTLFEDMLREEYLWSEEYIEEEDEARYEEEGGPFPDDLFYSFYYYSNEILKFNKDVLQEYAISADKEVAERIEHLSSLIS